MTNIYLFENRLQNIKIFESLNVIHYNYSNDSIIFDITFNKITKEFNLSYVDFIDESEQMYLTNSNFKIIIGPKFIPQHHDNIWSRIERPSLETKYFIGEHLDSISIQNQELINCMIYRILNTCRDQKVIRFDTDKDIRRCIALKINQPWYIFPG
jgi:hypothetical protein